MKHNDSRHILCTLPSSARYAQPSFVVSVFSSSVSLSFFLSIEVSNDDKGTKVVHQSPPGCIASEPGVDKPRFFDFETMGEYIIPRQGFCNRYVTICDPEDKHRILGHPVCIKDEKYERNEFMFNFCIVIGVDVDMTPYEAVVRRLASTFTEMEIQNQFLSQENLSTSKDRRSIAALIEIIKEDLNNYNECMIPVGRFRRRHVRIMLIRL
jgi:hypothetical protein